MAPDGRQERPLLMKGPLVVQTMEGVKTETRRIGDRFRKWKEGDVVYVRETWGAHFIWDGVAPSKIKHDDGKHCVFYKADGAIVGGCNEAQRKTWRPAIHMPKWASRVWLELTEDVRYEPLQDITEEGALAEGVSVNAPVPGYPRLSFAKLWDSINSARGYSWADNPEVAVIRYRLLSTTGRPTP